MPDLPARDPRDSDKLQFSLNLPKWIVEELDVIAAAEGYSRAEVLREISRSFVVEWRAKHATGKKSAK